MLLLAVDDTDARDGMCTTYLANRILAAFPERAPAALPRLVRLNPGIPWKTRGNAALCVALAGDAGAAELDEANERLGRVVREHARVDAQGTDPGWAVAAAPVDERMYLRAVRDVVPLADAIAALRAGGCRWGGLKAKRGLIGAAAALAWRPEARDHTFERISYRPRERWGTPRALDDASVRVLARDFPSTFDSYDEENGEIVMAPASPCPVLFGVRGDDASVLAAAAAAVRGEAESEHTLFVTNQATDDHLVASSLAGLSPPRGARVKARVARAPYAKGGHAFVTVEDGTGEALCAAFAPTRAFRRVVLDLAVGDEVTVCGGVRDFDGAPGLRLIALEKLELRAPASSVAKIANPACPGCGRRMKSAGSLAGYRCRECRTSAPPGSTERRVHREKITVGWREVPSRARRHLAMPLRRQGFASARLARIPESVE